jgi:hypothetical protein
LVAGPDNYCFEKETSFLQRFDVIYFFDWKLVPLLAETIGHNLSTIDGPRKSGCCLQEKSGQRTKIRDIP